MNRREFLKTIGRWAAGTAVAGTAVQMARRENCTNKGICSGCGSLNGCVLPQAASYRLAKKEGRVG